MKKITLFFVAAALFSNCNIYAQSTRGGDIDNNALNPAAMLNQLDVSEISTGIYNRFVIQEEPS